MKGRSFTLAVVCGACCLAALPVMAVADTGSTVISGGDAFAAFEPYLIAGLGSLITGLIGWGAAALQKVSGISIEQSHRDALHSAAMTGVNLALSKLGVLASSLTIDTKSAVIAQAVLWVEQSVPDALAHFGLTPEQLSDFIESKLGVVAAASPAPLHVLEPSIGTFVPAAA